jgi:hypothetical protein
VHSAMGEVAARHGGRNPREIASMALTQPTSRSPGPPSPPIHDGPRARYRLVGSSCSWGTAAQATARRELFAASDVRLTVGCESLIQQYSALRPISKSEDLRSHVSLPQAPSPTHARRGLVRYADPHSGSPPGGARGRSSSAGCSARGRRARDAPAPPDPRRESARGPEPHCQWAVWRGQPDPRGGRASSDASSAP